MQLASKVLVALFFVGILGSLAVIVITLIEDLQLFFHHTEMTDPNGSKEKMPNREQRSHKARAA